jgi:hypothetical protein
LVVTGAMSALLLLPSGVAAQAPAGDPFAAELKMKPFAKTRTAGLSVKAVNVPSGKTVKGFFLSLNENADPAPGATGWKVQPTTFPLPDQDGFHTVYAWAKHSGTPQVVTATPDSDTIFLDRELPVIDTFTGPNGTTVTSQTINVDIEASDPGFTADPRTGSGVVRYAIRMGTTPPDPGSTLWKTSSPSTFKLSKGNGSKTYSAWVRDAAGNVSLASTKTVTLATALPTVDFNILKDYSNSLTLGVSWTTTDPVGGGLQFLWKGNSTTPLPTATGWKAKPGQITLSAGTGARTIYAWVKDANDAISAVDSDTVVIDTTAPTASFLFDDPVTTTRTTDISIAIDADGVGEAPVTHWALKNGTSAPTLSSDWKAYPANAVPTTYQLSLENGTKTVSLFLKDAAGNVTPAITDTIVMNVPAPTISSVKINNDAVYAKSLTVNVAVVASAASGLSITGYCLQAAAAPVPTDASCSTGWKAAASSFTFSAGEGTRSVFVYVKDNNKSVSSVASDSISVDTVAPVATLTITNDNSACVSLEVGGSDTGGSGVAHYAVRSPSTTAPGFPNSEWKTVAANATVTLNSGAQLVTAFTRDAAGNVSVVGSGNSKTVTVNPGNTGPCS